MVVAWALSSNPPSDGYLECNGQAVESYKEMLPEIFLAHFMLLTLDIVEQMVFFLWLAQV